MFETLVGSEDYTTNIQKARQGRFSNDRSDRQAFDDVLACERSATI